MVKVAAPMLSLDASGTIANSMTFSKWKGRNYVRTRVIPANPRSPKQTGIRAMISFLSKQWASLGASNQATWEEPAKQSNVSPFNAYTAANAFDWRNGLYPSKSYPAARSSTAPSAPTVSASGAQRQATITITKGATGPTWGYSIHRSTSSGFSPSWTNCIALVPIDSNGNAAYIDTPLPAGTYYYTAIPFNDDGKPGTAATQASATVT